MVSFSLEKIVKKEAGTFTRQQFRCRIKVRLSKDKNLNNRAVFCNLSSIHKRFSRIINPFLRPDNSVAFIIFDFWKYWPDKNQDLSSGPYAGQMKVFRT